MPSLAKCLRKVQPKLTVKGADVIAAAINRKTVASLTVLDKKALHCATAPVRTQRGRSRTPKRGRAKKSPVSTKGHTYTKHVTDAMKCLASTNLSQQDKMRTAADTWNKHTDSCPLIKQAAGVSSSKAKSPKGRGVPGWF